MVNQHQVSSSQKSILTIFLCLSVFFGFVNNQKFGGGISTQIIFYMLYVFFHLVFKVKIRFKNYHLYMLLFWVLLFISTIFSEVVTIKRDIFTFLISVIFFIMVTGNKYNKSEMKIIIWTYISASILSATSILLNILVGNQYASGRYTAAFFGVDKDPNYVIAFMIPSVLILLFSLEKKENIIIKSVTLVIISFGIIGTASRAGFLSLVFCYFYAVFRYVLSNKKKITDKILMIIIISTLIILMLYFLPSIIPINVIDRTTNPESYTDDIRLVFWRNILGIFFSTNPLFGLGLNGGNSVNSNMGASHNIFIDILTSAGLIGAVFMILIFINLVLGKKIDRYYLIGIQISFFLPLFFINGFNTPIFWTPLIIMGIFLGYSMDTKEELPNWI